MRSLLQQTLPETSHPRLKPLETLDHSGFVRTEIRTDNLLSGTGGGTEADTSHVFESQQTARDSKV